MEPSARARHARQMQEGWARRTAVTALLHDFRPDAVLSAGPSALRYVPLWDPWISRPLVHLELPDATPELLQRWTDAVVVITGGTRPPAPPGALVARSAVGDGTVYIALGDEARRALIRLQQVALVTV